MNKEPLPSGWFVIVLCLCFPAGLPSSLAGVLGSQPGPVNVQLLMRNVAWNELQAREHPAHFYECTLTQQTPWVSQTSFEIQTRQGAVSRLTEVNGKPPTLKQCRSNLTLLGRIAASPRLQQSRLRTQRSNMMRREQLFKAMPDAFLFRYDGTEKSTGWLRISYRPNPRFRPSSRAAGVLAGLQGTLWVDPARQRLTRIQGRLNKDVTFGWGILARLYRGGQFVLKQSRIADGSWQVSTLFVRFQGTILLFKKLNVNMKQTFRSYKEVSDTLTLTQAIERLKRVSVPCTGP